MESIKTDESAEQSFWAIENFSPKSIHDRYYSYIDDKTRETVIPIFFTQKDAEKFFVNSSLSIKKWSVKQLRLSYLIALLLIEDRQNSNIALFYSYDSMEKGWGIKKVFISVKDDYYKE